MTSLGAIAGYAFVAGVIGTFGGLGGAVLLVPVLVVAGLDPAEAAPVGLLTVIAASVAAAPPQIVAGVVHHRVGVLTETAASAGAMLGAAGAGAASEDLLRACLAGVALLGALLVVGARRHDAEADPAFAAEVAGEWPGTLAGAAPGPTDGGRVIPYSAERPAAGVALMAGAGLVAGVAGVSGGYLKTPVLARVMGLPARVAAATTTFSVGVTATAALSVFLANGHVRLDVAAAAVAGALPGGIVGASAQTRAPERVVRFILFGALVSVGVALLVQ